MKFSLISRRVHMYFALALVPWMLMYAVSAIVMNHFGGHHHGGIPKYEKEAEKVYTRTFADDIEPQMMAEQILADLGLGGSHYFQERSDKTGITIHRYSPVRSKRITYNSVDKKLVIERLTFEIIPVLRHLHVRRGYQNKYVIDDAWAVSIDLIIFAMFFWIVSGLYLWYGRKTMRRWGIVCIVAGAVLFVFLVCAL